MTIYVPDPDPGRCRNYRFVGGQTLRCLEYEDSEHVCSFPEVILPVQWPQGNQSFSSTVKPKPWVKPVASVESEK